MWFKHGFLFKWTNYRFKHVCLNSQWCCSLNVLVQQRLGSLSIWTWNAYFRINSLIWRPVSTHFVLTLHKHRENHQHLPITSNNCSQKPLELSSWSDLSPQLCWKSASGGFRWFRSAWFLELSWIVLFSQIKRKMSGINTSVCEPKNDGGQGQGVLPMYHKAQFEGPPH